MAWKLSVRAYNGLRTREKLFSLFFLFHLLSPLSLSSSFFLSLSLSLSPSLFLSVFIRLYPFLTSSFMSRRGRPHAAIRRPLAAATAPSSRVTRAVLSRGRRRFSRLVRVFSHELLAAICRCGGTRVPEKWPVVTDATGKTTRTTGRIRPRPRPAVATVAWWGLRRSWELWLRRWPRPWSSTDKSWLVRTRTWRTVRAAHVSRGIGARELVRLSGTHLAGLPMEI